MLLLTVSYPLALHLTIIQGYVQSAVWILFVISLAHTLLVFVSGAGNRLAHILAPVVLIVTAISLIIGDATVLYLPPILIASSLLVLFGRTLLPGEEPLITQFARKLEGEEDETVLNYTRQLTWVWTLFFVAMLIESILLALFAPIVVWSIFTNLINYLLIAGLFVLELVYRMIRFRRLPSANSLRKIFKKMG